MDPEKKVRLERQLGLLFETAKRSLLVVEELSEEIRQELHGFESDINAGKDIGQRAVAPLVRAVSFVDFSYRFLECLRFMPFISRRAPEIRALETALRTIEPARHYFEHMRGEFADGFEIDYPLLGAFSWANGMTAYTLSLSQPGAASVPTIALDTHTMKWVSEHVFIVQHAYVDLDSIPIAMRSAMEWLLTFIRASDPSHMELKWGNTFAVRAAFSLTPHRDPKSE